MTAMASIALLNVFTSSSVSTLLTN